MEKGSAVTGKMEGDRFVCPRDLVVMRKKKRRRSFQDAHQYTRVVYYDGLDRSSGSSSSSSRSEVFVVRELFLIPISSWLWFQIKLFLLVLKPVSENKHIKYGPDSYVVDGVISLAVHRFESFLLPLLKKEEEEKIKKNKEEGEEKDGEEDNVVGLVNLQDVDSKETLWTIVENPKAAPIPQDMLPWTHRGTRTLLSRFVPADQVVGSALATKHLVSQNVPRALIHFVLFLADCPNPEIGKYFSKSLFPGM